jgi:hypothetical protein
VLTDGLIRISNIAPQLGSAGEPCRRRPAGGDLSNKAIIPDIACNAAVSVNP